MKVAIKSLSVISHLLCTNTTRYLQRIRMLLTKYLVYATVEIEPNAAVQKLA